MHPLARKLALVHLPPSDQAIDIERWQARGALLRVLGWQGSVGLCPVPRTDRQSAPLPLTEIAEQSPALRVLEALGCRRAHGTRALTVSVMNPEDYQLDVAVRDAGSKATLGTFVALLRNRGQNALAQAHVLTMLQRVREQNATLAPRETLFVASEHAWLLLAVAYQTCVATDQEKILRHSIGELPGICVIHDGGYLGGFVELSSNIPIQWYLDRR